MSARVAITIGNFDGVHRGHLALIEAARAAVGPDGRIVVLSFDPHPARVLSGDGSRPRLTRFPRRSALLQAAGADEVRCLEPTLELLGLEPEDFLARCAEQFNPAVIVEGLDFRFGRGRSGSVETLERLEPRFGYRTITVPTIEVPLTDQHIVPASSTIVRWLIGHGRVRDAARVLGRPVELEGDVVSGDRRGRTLGIPTANLDHGDLLLPADGIYCGRGVRDGVSYPAAISVGTKPTFGTSARTCEAHLLDYPGEIDEYGWTLRVQITDWLRDQIKYDSVEQLCAQLDRDLEQTRARHDHPEPAPA